MKKLWFNFGSISITLKSSSLLCCSGDDHVSDNNYWKFCNRFISLDGPSSETSIFAFKLYHLLNGWPGCLSTHCLLGFGLIIQVHQRIISLFKVLFNVNKRKRRS